MFCFVVTAANAAVPTRMCKKGTGPRSAVDWGQPIVLDTAMRVARAVRLTFGNESIVDRFEAQVRPFFEKSTDKKYRVYTETVAVGRASHARARMV